MTARFCLKSWISGGWTRSGDATAMDRELFVYCFEEKLEVDDEFGLEVVRVERDSQHIEDKVFARGSVGVDREC